MKLAGFAVLGAIACAFAFASMSAQAVPPPPPPGVHLMPGMVWCPRCGGHGRVPSGFLGLNDKRCPECKGYRMLAVRGHHHPVAVPPPPPSHVDHHHHHHHAEPVRPMPPPPPPAPVRRVPVHR